MKYLIANWKMNSVDINVWEQEFVNLVTSQNNFPKSGEVKLIVCLLYTSPSPRDRQKSRMPSSA